MAVALAGVIDLERAAGDHLGSDAVEEFFGGLPDSDASPKRLLPIGVPQLAVHGTADDEVPVSHGRAYVAHAEAVGDTIEYLELEGAGHWVLIDDRSTEWDRIAAIVVERLGLP
jgi:pimeloyl-ACP methyl ester carboxylesterase